ncbi:MAG: FHA domain-containing protein [Lachnospiraceae bacterium]|nr:FHA domain-containing protein [Lachnospiraceae bacterium]
MLVLLLACAACGVGELICFLVCRKRRKKRKRDTFKSIYKLMERRVLDKTLQNRITSDQAASEEYQSLFLRVEFPDTTPWVASVFALDEPVTIGRSRENKISLRDGEVSRIHCKIARVGFNLYLQDLGSANGTLLRHGLFRKCSMKAQQIESLEDGDRIVIGNFRLRIRVFYGREAAEYYNG